MSQGRWNRKDSQGGTCGIWLFPASPFHSSLPCSLKAWEPPCSVLSPQSCSEPAVLCGAAPLGLVLQGPFRVQCYCFSSGCILLPSYLTWGALRRARPQSCGYDQEEGLPPLLQLCCVHSNPAQRGAKVTLLSRAPAALQNSPVIFHIFDFLSKPPALSFCSFSQDFSPCQDFLW